MQANEEIEIEKGWGRDWAGRGSEGGRDRRGGQGGMEKKYISKSR